MTELLRCFPAFGLGAGASLIFFGSLWWTIKTGISQRKKSNFFLKSFLIRAIVVVALFLCVCRGSGCAWGFCLTGFIGTRILLTNLVKRTISRDLSNRPRTKDVRNAY
ncbi:MAG: ATP synthase subunit I [Candidatus Riflebacteria bacterium]|nr:ATP synthase subunit I [Candidatus Riflebacteria bacterium]